MSFSFGGGSSSSRDSGSSTVTARALTKEEKDLLKTQNEVLKLELEQIKRQNEALETIFPEAKDILSALTASTSRVVGVFDQALTALGGDIAAETEFKAASDAEALKVLRGEAPVVTPQEQALLDTIFETERQRGIQDITRFAEEAASARGLRVTDTPIGSEAVRGIREFSEGLGAEKARTTLALGQQGFTNREAVRQFQEGLRFQAQQNRLALTGMSPFALQAPISTVTPAQAAQSVGGTLGTLIQRPVNETFDRRSSGSWNTWNANINVAQIAGAAVGAFSTAKVKRDILPLDQDEYDAALAKLREAPITRWNYVWDAKDRPKRTGVILELAPDEIKEDANRLDLVSYAGMLHAGLKAVDRKVTRLALEATR